MSVIEVRGQRPLKGELIVQGSKNAVLPMMAASVLNKGITVIDNVPRIQDVFCMMGILDSLGCCCTLRQHRLQINAAGLWGASISRNDMETMRSSILLLGPLLGRLGEASVYEPGGCMIGKRPIDLHLMALKRLGAAVEEGGEGKPLTARAKRLSGAAIEFPYPSVGATENAICAAVAASGRTVLTGCAREPEIEELCRFLTGMGALIRGAGSPVITIEGGLALHDCHYRAGGDRIVAGTYLLAAAGTGGEIALTGIGAGQLRPVLCALKRLGGFLYEEEGLLFFKSQGRPAALTAVTGPHPGFPTDLQSVLMAVLSVADGESAVRETVFESRFATAGELAKLGADIRLDCDTARIRGRERLYCASGEAKALPGGGALVVAGVRADGVTRIGGCKYIVRGYEDICRDLAGLGASIAWRQRGRTEEAGR